MSIGNLRIWTDYDAAMAALQAANARAYQQTEPMRPTTVKTEGRWNGMIKYFFTRCEELSNERGND